MLFSMKLRMNEKTFDLEIKENETFDSIIQRLCPNGDKEEKHHLQNKIIDSLLKTKELSTTKDSLKQKIDQFLSISLTKQSNGKKKSLQLKVLKNIQNKPTNKIRQKQLLQRCHTIQQQSSSSVKQKQINHFSTDEQDLICAYKIVLQKSKDQQMKSLVEKTLAQLESKRAKKLKQQLVSKPRLSAERNSINSVLTKYLYNPVRRSVYAIPCEKSERSYKSIERIVPVVRQEWKEQIEQDNISRVLKTRGESSQIKSSENYQRKYNYLENNM